MKIKLHLASFRLKQFKAVQDSKTIKFTPLTAFIGNNGSGKSSIIEGLETLQALALYGIDAAMQPWRGFEHIWNQAKDHKERTIDGIDQRVNPMLFSFRGYLTKDTPSIIKSHIEITANSSFDRVFFNKYMASYSSSKLTERQDYIANGEITDPYLKAYVEDWQFLRLTPQFMTDPMPQKRSVRKTKLSKNGSNIAEYLQSIRDKDLQSFNGIIEALKVVLPLAIDLQPIITSELERKVYLALSEENIREKLPSWLISSGTLRILALLALLRDPDPPPVIIIEEIENGLDPRTIHLLVDEIRTFVESGRGQVICTTHSPFLLDLLNLSQIIVVNRDASNAPQFTRPASEKELEEWAKKFSPGRLYTMGKLARS